MKRIWTMGEMIVEIMRTKPDIPHDVAETYRGPFPSGAPAIMISAAARMGANCGIVGAVGNDAFGDMMIKRLASQGVNCSQIKVNKEKSTGAAFVMYHADGSREFIFHISGTAADTAEVLDDTLFENAGFFHVMGCSLTVSTEFCKKIVDTAKQFLGSGAKISFDPNLRPELLKDGDLNAVIAPIIDNCSILMPGIEELLLISGCNCIESAVEKMFKNPVLEIIALKEGSKGCRIFTREKGISAKAYKVIQEDATGAGDCFDGAFLAALASGKSIEEAAVDANAAGALNAAAFGPMEGNISAESVRELARQR